MSDAIQIAAAVDGIERYIAEIEEAIVDVTDADQWRIAIGLVHDASDQLWKLKRQMLDEAMRRTRDRRSRL